MSTSYSKGRKNMMPDLISGKTINELYKYLQSGGGSYNDLRGYFRNSKIEPREDVIHTSTRSKDKFLDQYIRPLRLNNTEDVNRLIVFIEQILTVIDNPNMRSLLESLSQDGWQILGSKLTRIGHGVEDIMTSMIQGNPIDTIQREWDRAKKSMIDDPADALTAASSMIEATYKYIIHQRQIPPPANQDIRGLAKVVHQALDIAPDKEVDPDFRSVLQGTITIIQGIGTIRTKIGDAHGTSPGRVEPSEQHARLVTTLAGAISLYLLEIHISNKV